MSKLATWLGYGLLSVSLGGVLTLSGCSAYSRLKPSGGSGDKAPAAVPSPSNATGNSKGIDPVSKPTGVQPVETYLEGQMRLPTRLKAEALTVNFRSNLDGAVFDCALGIVREFTPCPQGDTYDFGRLVHGRSYQLKVRARDERTDRADESPLVVAFVVDLQAGSVAMVAPSMAPTAPESADELPSQAENRLLQVGSFYGVNTAPGYMVTSYATTKTTDSSLRSMRVTGDADLAQIYDGRPCDLRYERESPGPDGLSYCESSPTENEWQALSQTLPANHLEIVRDSIAQTAGADEKLFVAAFDHEGDPADGRLGIGDTCRNAVSRGETEVPLIYGFYAASPTVAPFSWCQVRDRRGRYWWIGAFTAPIGTGAEVGGITVTATSPHVSVIYTASSQLGIFSGSQFAVRAGDFIAAVLVPIAPAANP